MLLVELPFELRNILLHAAVQATQFAGSDPEHCGSSCSKRCENCKNETLLEVHRKQQLRTTMGGSPPCSGSFKFSLWQRTVCRRGVHQGVRPALLEWLHMYRQGCMAMSGRACSGNDYGSQWSCM